MSMLGERALERIRRASDSYVAGVLTPGAASSSPFNGSVQPMSGSDRALMKEGGTTRTGRGKKIYCPQGTLQAGDHQAGVAADVVRIDGVDYTVVHVDNEHPLIGHDRAYVVLVTEAG
jgi:hypothetical protein